MATKGVSEEVTFKLRSEGQVEIRSGGSAFQEKVPEKTKVLKQK